MITRYFYDTKEYQTVPKASISVVSTPNSLQLDFHGFTVPAVKIDTGDDWEVIGDGESVAKILEELVFDSGRCEHNLVLDETSTTAQFTSNLSLGELNSISRLLQKALESCQGLIGRSWRIEFVRSLEEQLV